MAGSIKSSVIYAAGTELLCLSDSAVQAYTAVLSASRSLLTESRRGNDAGVLEGCVRM